MIVRGKDNITPMLRRYERAGLKLSQAWEAFINAGITSKECVFLAFKGKTLYESPKIPFRALPKKYVIGDPRIYDCLVAIGEMEYPDVPYLVIKESGYRPSRQKQRDMLEKLRIENLGAELVCDTDKAPIAELAEIPDGMRYTGNKEIDPELADLLVYDVLAGVRRNRMRDEIAKMFGVENIVRNDEINDRILIAIGDDDLDIRGMKIKDLLEWDLNMRRKIQQELSAFPIIVIDEKQASDLIRERAALVSDLHLLLFTCAKQAFDQMGKKHIDRGARIDEVVDVLRKIQDEDIVGTIKNYNVGIPLEDLCI